VLTKCAASFKMKGFFVGAGLKPAPTKLEVLHPFNLIEAGN